MIPNHTNKLSVKRTFIELNEKEKQDKPKFKPYIGTEDNFTISVSKYFAIYTDKYFHCANERKTKVKVNKKGEKYSSEGNKLKAKGVRAGIIDFVCIEKRLEFIGIALELKVGRNKTTSEQEKWLKYFQEEGYYTFVSYSLDEVMAKIDWYFGANNVKQK